MQIYGNASDKGLIMYYLTSDERLVRLIIHYIIIKNKVTYAMWLYIGQVVMKLWFTILLYIHNNTIIRLLKHLVVGRRKRIH